MMQDNQARILNSLNRGFIDRSIVSEENIRTKFLTNDQDNNINVMDEIIREVEQCNTFTFSVAFITKSGLPELKCLLLDLKDKGLKGRIITSNYLMFNAPQMFRELLKIDNLEVRISDSSGYHAKGYLFEHDDYDTLIIGSSNLTASAMKVNHEWNIKVSSMTDGEVVREIKETIENTWNNSVELSEEWIIKYELQYEANQVLQVIEEEKMDYKEIKPNKMQQDALLGIEEVRNSGENRSLLVSATGTGKTYLAAFDVKRVKPKRFLFIVHREQILRKSIDSFQRVIGNDSREYGILSGTSKDKDKKYLFATVQSLSRDDHLNSYARDEFDYIVIDEVHRSGAATYLKIIDYFEPRFLLGMTATPERSDNINIFEIFDYNVAYEIRLQEALESELVCPFHYYGVTDYIKDGEVMDEVESLKHLASDERIDHLVEKIEYYGFDGKQVRGLIFTAGVKEAEEVSRKLNVRGYRTTFLEGTDSEEIREKTITDLENGVLEYIVTVNIFNEGIDIPSINQVVMMRETQSSIIFIQQLGRGLRLHPQKEFVTIIDYIGNYKNNYLIPMALSGDSSMNKDSIRRKTIDTSYIQGVSSINFERVAKERIFKSIAQSKLTNLKPMRDEYFKLKNRLGRVPLLKDFYLSNSIDPQLLSDYKKSYYSFLVNYDHDDFMKEYGYIKNPETIKVLELYSREFLNGKRNHEVVLTKHLLSLGSISFSELETLYKNKGMYFSEKTIESVLAMFNMEYYISTTRNTYQSFEIMIVENKVIKFSDQMNECLQDDIFKILLLDVLETSELVSKKYKQEKQFTIGELYTRRDVTRLLEWRKDISGTIFGYSLREGEVPIFVTLNKEDVESGVDYEDRFINSNIFRWYSRNKLTLDSEEVKKIIDAERNGNKLRLFVQTDDTTYDKDFYYLGEMHVIEDGYQNEFMTNGQSVVRIDMRMDKEIDLKLYDYLTRTQ